MQSSGQSRDVRGSEGPSRLGRQAATEDWHRAACAESDEEASNRPTAETDPSDCRWCFEEAFGGQPCPYHGERAQT